jgi:hypothetical protein
MPKQDRMQATLDDGTQNDLALVAEGRFPFLGPIDRLQSVSLCRVAPSWFQACRRKLLSLVFQVPLNKYQGAASGMCPPFFPASHRHHTSSSHFVRTNGGNCN